MRSSLFNYSVLSTLALLVLLASLAADPGAPETLPTPGTVLSEHSRDIGFDFKEVARSQVNPPNSFEGIGHFVFVYFRDEKICQCSREETVISPDGTIMIYTDTKDGKLKRFHARTRERVTLTNEFVGYPAGAVWDSHAKQAVITLALGKQKSLIVPF